MDVTRHSKARQCGKNPIYGSADTYGSVENARYYEPSATFVALRGDSIVGRAGL